ncbi:nacht and ankyrin domain containing protein [Diplodia corticola]|uniref:Nacht and ankyrin domain containing protein n=1 Tax=Diplodia corticola TaxID=236234 RepID=A0A1J9S5U3_9PEZI|nr:nacht and ankyrin domain containing protein [Diplodia corticola]OJD35887.1 nacht and ankyrin domain containing protein [Diplodia corticola]
MAKYTTYRIRGIPIGWAEDTTEARIKDALSTTGFVQVKLRSLAVDLSRPAESVATVDFANTPEGLSVSNGVDEWRIQIADGPLLFLDTHFRGCTPLYCPSQESWRSDLVAISGLNGHAFGALKKKKDSYMWLRDDLPRDLRETRIIIYGYDTRLEGSHSFQNVSDIGIKFRSALRGIRKPDPSKPLLLLGHSLGGIIIKEAIHKMRISPTEAD